MKATVNANGNNFKVPKAAPNMQRFMSSVAEEGQKLVDTIVPQPNRGF
jgi:hypothetical protein